MDIKPPYDAAHQGVHQFCGPVKIILVDTPKKQYNRAVNEATLLPLAHYLMGVTNISTLYHLLLSKISLALTFHILVCTYALQYFVQSAVMIMNPLNGPSTIMRERDRTQMHMILHIVTLLYLAAGVTCAVYTGTVRLTLHALVSSAACLLLVSNIVFGIFCFYIVGAEIGLVRYLHRVLGIATVLCCTGSYCTGMLDTHSTFFSQNEVKFMLIGVSILYTLLTLYQPILNLFVCINRRE